jgi:pantoate--beta-alanine ligase
MYIIHTVKELREHLAKSTFKALVPTMGNLHEGHLRLIDQAKEKSQAQNGMTIATIFVNRLQFGPNEDFDRYPRTLEMDCEKLASHGCDLVFAPDELELYPQKQSYTISPPKGIADILEGHFRPGFFTGVCTVVMKLFSMIQPQCAVFGKKDYQQLKVIQGMVSQFNLPIEIIGLETQRAKDGLALSSRNGYLSPEERQRAIELYEALQSVANSLKAPDAQSQAQAICEAKAQSLHRNGWDVDYLTLCKQDDLSPCSQAPLTDQDLVLLVAAKIGKTRLIDNLEIKH